MAILTISYDTSTGKFYSQLIGADQLAPAAVLSGKIGSGQIGSDHIVDLAATKLTGHLPPARISGLPYANLALSGRLADSDILSGITAAKLLSGYPGERVASGYPTVGLTGQIPQARISGLFVSGLMLSGAIQPDDIRFLAGMIARPTPPGCVLDLDFAEGTGVGANEVDRIKALTMVYDKSGLNNDGTLYPTPTEISVCDAITNWEATSGLLLSSVTAIKVEGAGSLRTLASGIASGASYYTRYNPAAVIDLSARNHLVFWGRFERPATEFANPRSYITDTSGYYRYWNLSGFVSGIWQKYKFPLATPDGQLSGIALAKIDHIDPVRVETIDTDPFTHYIDYLIANDRPVFEDSLFGKCLSFDGVNQSVETASVKLGFVDGTVLIWVKLKAESASESIIFYGTSSSHDGWSWELKTDGGKLRIYVTDGTGYSTFVGVKVINDDVWHLVGFSYRNSDGQTILYIDGQIDKSNTTRPNIYQGVFPVRIGRNWGSVGYYPQYMVGQAGPPLICNRILSADEIRGRYIQGLAKLGRLQGSLRLFTSGWAPKIHLDPETADLRAIDGAIRTSGQFYAGSQQVQLTNPLGYLTSAAISGWMGYPRLHSGLINPVNLINPAMISGLPYANLALSGRLADFDILSGITAAKILSGYLGWQVASGYPSDGLTGLIPPARISGLPYANLALSGRIANFDILSGITAAKILSGYTGLDGTSGYVLRAQGPGILPVHTTLLTASIQPSDTLRNSNDTIRSTYALTYTKVKEVLLNAALAICRLKFSLGSEVGYLHTVYGRIYKNDVAIGTARSHSVGAQGEYVEYSEDFSGWALNDLIQIYAYTSEGAKTASVKNMRFYYSRSIITLGSDTLVTVLETTADPTISMTNQDP